MSLELVTAPSSELISLDEAKAHVRVDTDDDDSLIERLVVAARDLAERHTGRAFITQSWRLWRDGWPETAQHTIEIPKPPLIAVTAVTVYGRSGAPTTLSSDAYVVDSASAPGRIVLADTTVLPVDLREVNAVSVAFQAGYGADAADVPAPIRNAILSLVANLYERRGDGIGEPPASALAQLAPFRVLNL